MLRHLVVKRLRSQFNNIDRRSSYDSFLVSALDREWDTKITLCAPHASGDDWREFESLQHASYLFVLLFRLSGLDPDGDRITVDQLRVIFASEVLAAADIQEGILLCFREVDMVVTPEDVQRAVRKWVGTRR
jgi:hypothetical protein